MFQWALYSHSLNAPVPSARDPFALCDNRNVAALGATCREGFAGASAKRFAIKDESLIEEMRAALRGDQDRAEVKRAAAGPAGVGGSVSVAATGSQATARTLRSRLAQFVCRHRPAI
jgi:hypothetical protein